MSSSNASCVAEAPPPAPRAPEPRPDTPGATAQRAQRWVWLPIPLFVAAIIALWVAGLRGTYESLHALLACNLIFSGLAGLFIVYLAARSFLVRSSPGVLLLGCGVMIWSAAGFVASACSGADPNTLITIHNTCVWLAALCHLIGVVLSVRPRRALRAPDLWLPAAYGLAACAVALVAIFTLAGWTPTFFVQGQGGTLLREVVLGSAIIMFALSALVLQATSPRPLSPFAYWYSLALALIATGLFGIALQSSTGSLLCWTGRGAQFLSGVYMVVAAVQSVRESQVWGIPLESALRESEERFRSVVESMSEGLMLFDAAGNLIYQNSASLRIHGFKTPADGLIERENLPATWKAWDDQDRAITFEEWPVSRVFRNERFQDQVLRVVRVETGLEFFGSYNGSPIYGSDGKLALGFITIRDITDRKRAEQKLQRSQTMLARAEQIAEVGSWEWDIASGAIIWSDQTYRMLGLEPGQLAPTYDAFIAAIHPEDRRRVEEKVAAWLSGAKPDDVEYRIVTPDSVTRWLHARGEIAVDDAGRPIRMIGAVRDITTHKKAEQALRESEERFRVAQELSPDGFLIFRPLRDKTGEVTDFLWLYENAAAARMNDTHPKDACGKRLSEVLPHHDKSPFHKAYKEVAETGEIRVLEEAFYDQDTFRQRRWFRAVAVPTSGGDVAILVQDVTQRRQAEAALRESEARYHSLFENMLEGSAYCQMIGDEKGRCVDFVYLEVNEAFGRLTGLKDVVGKRVSAVIPGVRDSHPELFEIYGRVASTGQPERFEIQFSPLNAWLSVSVYSPARGYFVAVFDNISARKQAEARLKADLAALTRMHALSGRLLEAEGLQPLLQEIMDAAVEIVGAERGTLQLLEGDSLRIVAHHGHKQPFLEFFASAETRASVCGEATKRGERVVVPDVEESPLFTGTPSLSVLRVAGVRAVQSTPMLSRSGELLGILTTQWGIPHSPDEHDLWRIDLLVRQAADLIERQRAEEEIRRQNAMLERHNTELEKRVAERAAEVARERQQLKEVLNMLPAYVILLDPDYRVPLANRFFEERFGKSEGRRCYEYLFNRTEPCENCESYKVMRTGAPHRWEWTGPDGRNYDIHDFPFTDTDGSKMIMEVGLDITERKRAEAAVQAERQRFLDMLDTLPVIIDIIRADHRIDWANRAYREALGDNVGQLCYGSQFGLQEPCTECQAFIPLQTGRPHHWEWTLPNGRTFDIHNFPFVAADGSPAVLEMDIDITERKRAEVAVQVERQRLYDVLETLPAMICLLTPDYHVSFANRSFREKFGESNGRHCYEFCFGRNQPCEFCESYNVLKTGQPHHWEVVTPDGSAVIACHDYPFTDVDGSPLILEMDIDITAHRRAEAALKELNETLEQRVAERTAALRESESRFRTMAEAIPQLAWTANADGWIHWYNRRWYEYTGTTPEQMEGWGWQSVHNPETLPAVLERWKGSIASGEPFDMVFPLRGADGVFRPFLTRVQPLKDSQGRVIQWFGTNTDVDELKRAEEALREAKQAAEEANAAKDKFLAVLSHELRTPLSPVLMTASALEYDDSLPAEVREDMALIRRSVELEVRLINDLLDFNRVKWSKLQLHLQPLDVHEKLRATIDICQSEAQEKQIEVSCALEAGARWVEADGARLQQVFWNVLKNAIKFTPEKGHIAVRSSNSASGEIRGGEPESGTLRIEVTDTGMGIDSEALPHVFEPFVQASKHVARQFGGLGLGLAISKTLVEMHGGTIRAESDGLGKGSTFIIELPAVAHLQEGSADQPALRDVKIRCLRVLVVEDHEPTAEVLSRLLAAMGHRVWTAGTVGAGLEKLQSEEFDLLISDLGLPDGSGHDLMRQVRELRPRLRAFTMSGYGMDADLEKSREAGFVEHLTKPVSLQTLQAAIRRVTGA